MNKELELVKIFHEKFHVPVLQKPSLISEDRYVNRYHLMDEEVQEYLARAKNGDLENVAKELVDILYAVYGAVLEHGLQDIFDSVFEEVHNSHMTKEYHEYKMIKGANYVKADIKKFFENSKQDRKNALDMTQ